MTECTLKANAKINLTLAVTGKREDGYHIVDTLMQSLDISDILHIAKSGRLTVSCDANGLCGEDNICFKAARIFFEDTGVDGGADIVIEKHIPISAGLGGGSADAAGVLCALNRIYNAGLTEQRLCELGARVGADVPFFIRGGTQRARGIGERLEALPSLCGCGFVIVKAGQKPSTAQMYGRLDKTPFNNPDTGAAAAAVCAGDLQALAQNLGNCFSVLWDLAEINGLFLKTNPLGVCLSGSGPAVFGMYKNIEDAKHAANYLINSGTEAYFAPPAKSGLEFI